MCSPTTLFKLLCRLCQLRSSSNNSVSIVGKHENGTNRITELLHVVKISRVTTVDGYHKDFCNIKCCRHVEGLEKVVKDLEELKQSGAASVTLNTAKQLKICGQAQVFRR